MKIKAVKAVFLALMLAIPALFLLLAQGGGGLRGALRTWTLPQELDLVIADQLPTAALSRAGGRLRLLCGQIEHGGIFVSRGGLLKNLDMGSASYVDGNVEAIGNFATEARQGGSRTYFALIPTSSAVLQQNLPGTALSRVTDQRSLIDSCYGKLLGAVQSIDVYSTLFAVRDQYIYYRTENSLTALGGYYASMALGSRLSEAGRAGNGLSSYDIEYVAGDYRGDLYRAVPFAPVQPDNVMIMKNNTGSLYTVRHTKKFSTKTYHSLYPMHMMRLDGVGSLPLGGSGPLITIESSGGKLSRSSSILVFGDRTAINFLPFLADRYQKITFIDLFDPYCDQSQVDIGEFYQILFVFSTESFVSSNQISDKIGIYNSSNWS